MYESEEIGKLVEHDRNVDSTCYYWMQKNRTDLLVTIGDSFTRGVGLEPWEWRDLYGAQLSASRHRDWINAGCAGGSNSWSLNFLDGAVDFLNASRYSNGTVILTLTENGRDIMTGNSRQFDYIDAYAHLPVDGVMLEKVLDHIELEWALRISNIRAKLDQRFQILIGNNFTWHEQLYRTLQNLDGIIVLENIWISLMPGTIEVPLIRSSILSVCMKELLNIIGSTATDAYKQWILDQSWSITRLQDSIADRKNFFCVHDPGHPNAQGQRIWAEYLNKFL